MYGFVDKNTKIDSNDIIIGKVIPIKGNKQYNYQDSSVNITVLMKKRLYR